MEPQEAGSLRFALVTLYHHLRNFQPQYSRFQKRERTIAVVFTWFEHQLSQPAMLTR